MKRILIISSLSFILCLSFSCLKDKYDPDLSEFPTEVSKIITTKCSRSGCHNTATVALGGASGLDLSTWDKMFNGSNNGASVIPYSTYYSTLLYFTNTDSLEGLVATPTMPVNDAPLSKAEYYTLRDWIAKGAPNKNGLVMFSDNPQRKKIYVSNQGCDMVEVFDAGRKVAMRVISVGTIPGTVPLESPHMIKVTPDNKYWIAVFSGFSQGYMQVYRTTDDSLVKNILIGNGGWNTFAISSDSKKAYAADFNNGKLVFVDLEAGVTTATYPFNTKLHGTALNKTDDTLYVGLNQTSDIFKIPVNDVLSFEQLNLNVIQPAPTNLMPHEILFSPDGSKYFVTCEGAAQVRVYDAHTDQQLAVIPVGPSPVEMAVSVKKNLLFVCCMGDAISPATSGSVRIIDINTLAEVKKIKTGVQPHGIAVDDEEGIAYFSNRNRDGSQLHHPAACDGNNGSLQGIDINTLSINPRIRAELSVDPYSITIRY